MTAIGGDSGSAAASLQTRLAIILWPRYVVITYVVT
jgi:hypothetical protein